MNIEKKEPREELSQEEVDAKTSSRVKSDAELLEGGARYEEGVMKDVDISGPKHEMLMEKLDGYKELYEDYEACGEAWKILNDLYKYTHHSDKYDEQKKHDLESAIRQVEERLVNSGSTNDNSVNHKISQLKLKIDQGHDVGGEINKEEIESGEVMAWDVYRDWGVSELAEYIRLRRKFLGDSMRHLTGSQNQEE